MRTHPISRRRQPGFGLLEAIVGLTILATLGLVLFDWIRQSLDGASRIRAEHARVEALISAQALIANVNPAVEPEGERSLEGLAVRWKSRLVAGPTALFGDTPSPDEVADGWQVGLYELSVNAAYTPVQDGPDTAPIEFKAMRTGTLVAGPGRSMPR